MSEAMIGVLLMPDDLFWSDDPVTRAQHNSIRKEAAEEIDRLRAEVEALREERSELRKKCDGRGLLKQAAEDLECAHMWLDDMSAPRKDSKNGETYSIIGRVIHCESLRGPEAGDLDNLREDKARLLRLVEQAYKEGHVRGVSGYDDPAGYEEQDWLDSEVRQAIDAAREEA